MKERKFADFYNVETKRSNIVYVEIEEGALKFVAAISPEKNADGKYEVYCHPHMPNGKMTYVNSIEEGKEAIVEYFSNEENISSN